MKLHKRKLIEKIVDSMYIIFRQLESRKITMEEIENKMPAEGNSVIMLTSFMEKTMPSEWYEEARVTVEIGFSKELEPVGSVKNFENRLCMVDLQSGICLYNILIYAYPDIDFSQFCE